MSYIICFSPDDRRRRPLPMNNMLSITGIVLAAMAVGIQAANSIIPVR